MRCLEFLVLLGIAGSLFAAEGKIAVTPPDDKNAVAELEKLGAPLKKDEHGTVKEAAFGYAKATDATLVYLGGLHSVLRWTRLSRPRNAIS
jgi:hypothetical protein